MSISGPNSWTHRIFVVWEISIPPHSSFLRCLDSVLYKDIRKVYPNETSISHQIHPDRQVYVVVTKLFGEFDMKKGKALNPTIFTLFDAQTGEMYGGGYSGSPLTETNLPLTDEKKVQLELERYLLIKQSLFSPFKKRMPRQSNLLKILETLFHLLLSRLSVLRKRQMNCKKFKRK